MPTPRPTIEPITVAQAGMSTTYATSDSEPTPTARPSSAVPIGRPIATTDPNASSRITIAASRPRASPTPVGGLLEREVQVAAGLDPQRRRRRGDRRASCLEVLQVVRAQVLRSGYWTRTSATRPSGETIARAVPPGPGARRVPTASAGSGGSRPARRGSRRSVVARSRGVSTTSAPSPASSEPACASSWWLAWESSPGASNGSSRSRPNAAAEVTTRTPTTTQAPDDEPRAAGGEAAEPFRVRGTWWSPR